MDFLKLLQSFEDLLFELLSWVIYYPLTLWRVLTRPLTMIDYSNHEQTEAIKERYTDSLSPPLFLLVSIALMHAVELALGVPAMAAKTEAAKVITASDENLIVARSALFALLPLFAAWRYVAAARKPLERKHLRPPFYGQCYLAAAYAILLSVSILVARHNAGAWKVAAEVMAAVATLWYLTVQTRQFQQSLGWSVPKALFLALRAFAEAAIVFILAGLMISGLPDDL